MAAAPSQFDTVIRGYDRGQVNAAAKLINTRIARLRHELAEIQRQSKLATEHAEANETELRAQRESMLHAKPAAPDDSLACRAEKLLRMAEQEAAQVRSQAARDSAMMIEQARAEAERYSGAVEQSLIAQATRLDRDSVQRAANLQKREQQISAQLTAGQEQGNQLHATAMREADQLQKDAVAAAEKTKRHAQAAAKRQLDQAAQEVARLNGLQSGIRSQLARMAQTLAYQLGECPDSCETETRTSNK